MHVKLKDMCSVHKVTWILIWLGALNWGLIGAFNFNLLNALAGDRPIVERTLYVLVGFSALMMLMTGKCKMCAWTIGQKPKR